MTRTLNNDGDDPRVTDAARRNRARIRAPYLLALVLLGATFAAGSVIYDQLPEMLPTGWGPSGEVRGWAEKSFGTVFMTTIIGCGMFVMMGLVGLMAPMLSPSGRDLSPWSQLQVAAGHRTVTEYLGWVTALITAMLCWITVETWRLSAGTASPNLWGIALIMVAIFVVAIPVSRAQRRWAVRTAEQLGLHPTEEEAAEEALWLPMGIYNDPSNPAMMVPKREGYGVGTTVNVGSRKGRIAVVVFAIIILAPLVLIAVML